VEIRIEGKMVWEVIIEMISWGNSISNRAKAERNSLHLFVKIKDYGLSFLLFYFLILFSFDLFFHLFIFRTLGLGLEVISHTVTSVTSDGRVTTLIMELKRRK